MKRPTLTERQQEVLALLVQGNTMIEAANLLEITPRTVAFHKYRMMSALEITSSAEFDPLCRKTKDRLSAAAASPPTLDIRRTGTQASGRFGFGESYFWLSSAVSLSIACRTYWSTRTFGRLVCLLAYRKRVVWEGTLVTHHSMELAAHPLPAPSSFLPEA